MIQFGNSNLGCREVGNTRSPNRAHVLVCSIMVAIVAGCSNETVTDLGQGYFMVSHSSSVPHGGWNIQLAFRDTKGKKATVWPSLVIGWNGPLVGSECVLFAGGLPDPNYPTLAKRLFVAIQAGPPVDVTRPLLAKATTTTPPPITDNEDCGYGELKAVPDGVEIRFSTATFSVPTKAIQLSWKEVRHLATVGTNNGTRAGSEGTTYFISP